MRMRRVRIYERPKNVEMNAIKNNFIQSSANTIFELNLCARCAVCLWNQSNKYYWRLFVGRSFNCLLIFATKKKEKAEAKAQNSFHFKKWTNRRSKIKPKIPRSIGPGYEYDGREGIIVNYKYIAKSNR